VDLYNGATAPGGISVDGDTAYVVGPGGVATVSVPLIDGAVGRSKLGRPLSEMFGAAVPGAGGIVAGHRRSDGTVLVGDLDSDEDPTVLEPTAATPVEGLPALVAVSADGRLIAVAGMSGVLSVFDAVSMRLVHSIPYATDRPIDSKFTGGVGPAAGSYALAWWVSATTAILSTWDAVVSIDLETGQRRWEARGFRHQVTSVSVSTDETLVIASDFYGTTRLLRFDDGAPVGAPLANGSMTAAERGTEPVVRANVSLFRPDSHVAALADWDTGAVRFVDVDTRTETDPPLTVLAGLAAYDFSPDGHTLAVGGSQGSVRLYDLETRAQIGDPFPSTTSLTPAFFSADGRAMSVGGYPPIVYDVDPASWREKACTVAGRNLTKVEWRQYMPPDEQYRATCPDHRIES
jgi:WD40 repeat protein